MTMYGQNKGHFKLENNECIGTGARATLHKIKTVILCAMWWYDAFFVTKCVFMTSQ